jgi:hypothetical protein
MEIKASDLRIGNWIEIKKIDFEDLKASDLRIGNWIEIKKIDFEDLLDSLDLNENDYIPKKPYFQIAAIEKDQIRIDYFDEFEFDYSQIKPISLTEQWLIDLGFQDNNYTFDLYAKRKKIEFSWSVKVVSTGVRSCFYSSKYKHIKYVHQLQNLYHSLTGKELTK